LLDAGPIMREVVLVTGAYGFVGRNLARAMSNDGAYVIGIGHGNWGRDEWRQWGIAEWHTADINLESLTTYAAEPLSIFHCAGSGSVSFSITNPFQDWSRTVASTMAVLEYMRLLRPDTRLVIPSSAGVYGHVKSLPIRHDADLNPVSPYGVHKKVAEDLCRSYAEHFGLRIALVRLFSIYGVGLRKQLLWDACSKLSEGSGEFAGTGQETRDWLHVDDAARLMQVAAIHASTACPVVNGASGRQTPVSNVITLLASCLGAKSFRFTGTARNGDPQHYLADISPTKAWGWEPSKELEAEMAAYAEWFRAGAQ
jgi:UDP-glucose 4-epimerase